MKCPRCQHEGRPVAKFCEDCGTPLAGAAPARPYGDLKDEVEGLRHVLSEALQQKAATTEILRVISRFPTDTQPVFDAIAVNAARLCAATCSSVALLDGNWLNLVGRHNFPANAAARMPLADAPNSARVIREGVIFHVADTESDVRITPAALSLLRVLGVRAVLCVPMKREDTPLGSIYVYRAQSGFFSDDHIELLRVFADQAVIAIENVRLFKELESRNAALTEALNQQTATAEILGVLSASPTQVQPVFDAIVASAVRLCDGVHGAILRVDGNTIDHIAQFGHETVVLEEIRRHFPQPIDSAAPSSPLRAIRERRVVEVTDTETSPGVPDFIREAARRQGFRSELWVPMLHGENAVGTIVVTRREPGRFTDKQIALLQTFADQAVIAIENVRLFKELEARNRALTEALEQQTATSEILRVISSSPTDVQPVFDAIARSAVSLCEGSFAGVDRFDGKLIHRVAQHNIRPKGKEALEQAFPMLPSRRLATGRAVLHGHVIHIADVEADLEYDHDISRAVGMRSVLAVPLLRQGVAIGAIGVARDKPAPFSDQQVELLKTFADQAVIAIENVRLFTELQSSNRELTTALDQQTATSEILRAIAHAPTDTQPVFDTIVQSSARLCNAFTATVLLTDGTMLYLPANFGSSPDALAQARALFPRPLDTTTASGTAILTRSVVQIPDSEDPSVSEFVRQSGQLLGFRSSLAVPMLRGTEAIGAIRVTRREPSRFADAEVELLKTFADQAVIAIENVRLFKELQAKNAELTDALEQQTATSEILKVISSSPTDVQPVFDAIVRSASHLCGGEYAIVTRYDGEFLRLAAQYNARPGLANLTERLFPRRPSRDLPSGRAILDRVAAHIPDTAEDRDLAPDVAGIAGSYLSVPMVRDGVPVGAIGVSRATVGPFAPEQIALLETFADQAVIAIENVRLFKELEARTHDLTRSVDELRALAEVGQAISSTLDLQAVLKTIVTRAIQLTGVDAGAIYEYDEQREIFEPRATERLEEDIVQMLVHTPVRKGQGATGRLAEMPEPIQLADLRDIVEQVPVRDAFLRAGYRALLAVPLIREDHLIGGLTVFRRTAGEFAAATVDLLRTFATQSTLAIQNARLFREIADKSRQLEVASQHKSEFLANMSHELRTPLNAIIGFSEVLSERMFGELNEKQEEYLKDIHASGQHLLSLINDILDLSKIEAGRMELELTDFHLPAALDNALTLVRERAGRRGIALHMTADERLDYVRADERKVRQVVLNILSNAIKFTPEGGRIEVRAIPVDGSVQVSVTDTGVGIAPEDQEAIFEEFRQVGTADKKVEGTGLGLALSRKFIELHGGRIWVESQVGVGSTFTFTIPMERER
jgi:GAF domain-containing protein